MRPRLIADPGADMELEATPNYFTLPDAGAGVFTDAGEAFGIGTRLVVVREAGTAPLRALGGTVVVFAGTILRRRKKSGAPRPCRDSHSSRVAITLYRQAPAI